MSNGSQSAKAIGSAIAGLSLGLTSRITTKAATNPTAAEYPARATQARLILRSCFGVRGLGFVRRSSTASDPRPGNCGLDVIACYLRAGHVAIPRRRRECDVPLVALSRTIGE